MVAYWDASQRCRFANRAYLRWFGVAPEALIGTHIRDLLGPIYAQNLPYIEGALRGEHQTFEREIPDPAGGPARHSLAEYVPDVVDGEVRGFFVLVTDISAVKRASAQLAELEERFRLAIDGAPIGMAIVALDGRYVRVNAALCEIVGYTPAELTGLDFQTITHPDDLDADLESARKLVRGEIPRYHVAKRYVRKDGTPVDVMLSASVLRGADGAPRYFISQVEDISERKRLERELARSEARASGIVSISADAIISVDAAQRIVAFNAGAEHVFGHAAGEVIGLPLDVLLPARVRAAHREHVARFAAGAAAARRMGDRSASIVGLHKDGHEFPADASISRLVVGGEQLLTVALRDISEQKQTEDEQRFLADAGLVLAGSLDLDATLARVAELAVRELADLCIIDVIEADAEIRRVKCASHDPARAALCRQITEVPLDRARDHLMRAALAEGRAVVLPAPSAADIAAFAQSEAHRGLLEAAEIRSAIVVPLAARGRRLGALAFLSARPGRYGAGELRFAEEIARLAALAIENARLYEAAQRATRARDDVLAVVAHDLRNPINSIILQAQSIAAPATRTTPRGDRAVAAIVRSANRVNRLVQDLLDVASLEAGHLAMAPEEVSASELVLQLFDAQQPLAAAAGLELELAVPATLPDLEVDPHRVGQVFENLLGNAIKFTPAGGRITLGARVEPGEVWFWVTDTGPGIAAEDLPRLFDRFWQAHKGARHGAGLGLPIARGIVEAHGGRMWVESAPGAGTTFFFALPLRERAAVRAPARDA